MLAINWKVFFDHGSGRSVKPTHYIANHLQSSLAIANFDIKSAKLDRFDFTHLRTAASYFAEIFRIQCSLKRIFVTFTSLKGLNVARNTDIKEKVATFSGGFCKIEKRFLSRVELR